MIPLTDADAHRSSLLASLSDDELSPAALAARVALTDVTKGLIAEGIGPAPPFSKRESLLPGSDWRTRFGKLIVSLSCRKSDM